MVGNRWECHGKAGERWRRSEKIWYMTNMPVVTVFSMFDGGEDEHGFMMVVQQGRGLELSW